MKHAGIIRKVQITEKGTRLSCENRYLIEVAPKANKIEIKEAVEKQFGVHVLAVNTQNYKGALRTLKNRRVVRDPSWKRAIVTVKAGERIETV
ncbi:MAG TPA: 50S ribosomal protein L23 [Kiritimatiellia bacterium]|jgi:large subunit ribosomal protein L23|nr:50S ribosomal protein L23 [Kiritimatiellia bacterium]HOR97515.1 50S ribosomal protein L23 [Kiritimatiellia bacterium]HPC49795.1 50S ribosomal protein L23 [Kiritimatiellia bacterium]HPW75350.1 50S ribosomal protein L23 [Kiritimatiellia bacterium]